MVSVSNRTQHALAVGAALLSIAVVGVAGPPDPPEPVSVVLDASRTYQRVAGFGLSEPVQLGDPYASTALADRALELLFDRDRGAGLSIIRVPAVENPQWSFSGAVQARLCRRAADYGVRTVYADLSGHPATELPAIVSRYRLAGVPVSHVGLAARSTSDATWPADSGDPVEVVDPHAWWADDDGPRSWHWAWDDGTVGSGFAWADRILAALTAGTEAYLVGSGPGLVRSAGAAVDGSPHLWALGGFSRHIRPGAVRVAASSAAPAVRVAAFANPDGTLSVIVLNAAPRAVPMSFTGLGPARATPYRTNSGLHGAIGWPIPVTAGGFRDSVPARTLVTYHIRPTGPTP